MSHAYIFYCYCLLHLFFWSSHSHLYPPSSTNNQYQLSSWSSIFIERQRRMKREFFNWVDKTGTMHKTAWKFEIGMPSQADKENSEKHEMNHEKQQNSEKLTFFRYFKYAMLNECKASAISHACWVIMMNAFLLLGQREGVCYMFCNIWDDMISEWTMKLYIVYP